MFALLCGGLTQALQFHAQQRVLFAQTLDFNIFDVEELKGGKVKKTTSAERSFALKL